MSMSLLTGRPQDAGHTTDRSPKRRRRRNLPLVKRAGTLRLAIRTGFNTAGTAAPLQMCAAAMGRGDGSADSGWGL